MTPESSSRNSLAVHMGKLGLREGKTLVPGCTGIRGDLHWNEFQPCHFLVV